jgi:hypothetical protein
MRDHSQKALEVQNLLADQRRNLLIQKVENHLAKQTSSANLRDLSKARMSGRIRHQEATEVLVRRSSQAREPMEW